MVMRGKSAWRKNNRREIKKTIERYLAIFAIIALGTGFCRTKGYSEGNG